jgi:hypothetical protein
MKFSFSINSVFVKTALFLFAFFCNIIPLSSQETLESLATHPHWLTLLHYKKSFNGYKSEISSNDFFLSPNGSNSPESELYESYLYFFIYEDVEKISKYPARYRWMCKQLNQPMLDFEKRSERYQKYIHALGKIEKVYYIFATNYVYKPEAIYGHTLLRLDGKNGSAMLGRTIEYTANTDGSNPVEYFTKGISGGFKGQYSAVSYYKKISHYSYKQSQDLYEYELSLTQDQVAMLVDHLYELDSIQKPYFFFTDNCAYNVFYLIDSAYEDAQLTNLLKYWVIPYDTVRILHKEGLIKTSQYRPSIGTVISRRTNGLTKEEIEHAKTLAEFKETSPEFLSSSTVSDESKVRIIDLATDYYLYQHYPKVNSKQALDAVNRRVIQLSRIRSKYTSRSTSDPGREDPLIGHSPFLLESDAVYRNSSAWLTTTLRTSYHDFYDPPVGYTFGGEVIFSSVTLGYTLTDNSINPEHLFLDRATLVKISSFKPQNQLLTPLSWFFDAGVERERPRTNNLGAYFNSGFGKSFSLTDSLYIYALGGGYLTASKESRAAPEFKGGLLFNVPNGDRVTAGIVSRHYIVEADDILINGNLSYTHTLMREAAIVGSFEEDFYNGKFYDQLSLALRFYF